MIALDSIVLIRYLVDDGPQQGAARALLVYLISVRFDFVCREVAVELAWILNQAYVLSWTGLQRCLKKLLQLKNFTSKQPTMATALSMATAETVQFFQSDDIR